MDTIDLVVGYDRREAIAYHVFCQSVLERASLPVRFLPLTPQGVAGYVETQDDGSNAFTYRRFLTPQLMGFRGWAIFADGDMVCEADIAELWRLRDPEKAVLVAQHDYQTKVTTKYLGAKNENYPRKNWSSLILWNCAHPANRLLTPEFVASKNGAFLHRFMWLEDAQVGALPLEWNWLATEYEPNDGARIVHYTLGTPCFRDYRDADMADRWHAAHRQMQEGMDA
jgi:lipopolysaccharide biosynthesis glycosyltransferase